MANLGDLGSFMMLVIKARDKGGSFVDARARTDLMPSEDFAILGNRIPC